MWLGALERIFNQQDYSNSTARLKKALYLFIQLQILAQNIYFFWNPDIQIKAWNSYENFWVFLSFPCLDSLAVTLGLISSFLFTEIGFILFTTASFILSALLLRFQKEIPHALPFIQKICFEFLCNIYFIPCTNALISLVKYSSHDYAYIDEYSQSVPGSVMNYGDLGVAVGVLALILHMSLTMIYESCSYDMTYSLKNNFYSKSHPYVGIYLKIFICAQCIMMSNLQLSNYDLFLKIDFLLYLFASMLILYFAPYYSLFTNAVQFWLYIDSTFICSAFLLGLVNDSSTLIFVLTIMSQPFIMYLSYEIVKYRTSKFKPLIGTIHSSFTNFEHSARSHLMSGNKDVKVLKEINKQMWKNSNKLFKVLCANYCLETLENSKLAQIKIEKITTFTLNLPAMYNIYKCKNTLNKINLPNSKGLKWLIFSQNLESAMKTDLDVCNSLMMMYNKFLDTKTNLSDLKFLVLRSSSLIDTAVKSYGKLLEEIPHSKFVLELYGLFLIDILNNREAGSGYYNKGNGLARQSSMQRNSGNLSVDNCRFIVSGNTRDLGRFLHANLLALEFLKISKINLSSTYIFEFIPVAFQKLHKEFLSNFADKCLTDTIPCNVFPFLLINGYLVECTSTTECVVYEQNTYFVTFLDPIGDLGREVVLIDFGGVIISHSAGLSSIFEIQNTHIEGQNINDYLPIEYSSLSLGTPVKLELTLALEFPIKLKLVVVFVNQSHVSSKYFTLYITTEEDEINEWCKQDFAPIVNTEHIELPNPATIKKLRFKENTENLEHLQFQEEEKNLKNSSYSSSNFLQETKESKSLIISLRSLRAIKLLLIFSVNTIQNITLIATILTCAVALYEISLQLNDLSIIQDLGELNYWLIVMSIIIRCDEIDMMTNSPLSTSVSSIQSFLVFIQESYRQIGNDTLNWPSCPGTDIAGNNAIPYWKFINGAPVLGFSNLQDYIGETIRSVKYI